MTFPIIRTIEDLLPHIAHKNEISVKKQSNGTTVVCYVFSNEDTFENEHLRECRGITFDEDGVILLRPLHKFFNLGEKHETGRSALPWKKTKRVMEKKDGSMISFAFYKGKIVAKTKKSFETPQAARALEFLKQRHNYVHFIEKCDSFGWTPTFEWCSPKDRIVLDYKEDSLVLLHIRDKVTGEYLDLDLAETLGVETVNEHQVDPKKLIKTLKTDEGIEGYVIQFESGDMVKMKTDEYLKLHRSITFIRERDIAKLVLDEKLDDLKSLFKDHNFSVDKIKKVEDKVVAELLEIKKQSEKLFNDHKHLSRKDFALAVKDQPFYGHAFVLYSGQEPDYKKWFAMNRLPEYSLESV